MTTHKAISKIVYVHIYLPGEGKKNSANSSFQEKHNHGWHTKVRKGKSRTVDNLQVAFMNIL